MRRLLLALCLLVLPVFATAQHREALLTPDGTLFTIESRTTEFDGTSYGTAHLLLREQRGAEVIQELVPASLTGGAHSEPAIAFDPESRTLFVFWLRHFGLMGSQLMFACRDANGTWSPAEAFGHEFNGRNNLRIALTRRVLEQDGTISAAPALSVHLVWWEYDSEVIAEAARYAMMTIENGRVASMEYLDLAPFAVAAEGEEIAADADRSVLKQPLLFTAQQQESVLVIFGNLNTSRMHQVRVRPTKVVAEGRLRVPVGKGEGSARQPAFRVTGNSRIDGIYGGDASRLALYTRNANNLQYVIMRDGVWTETHTIALDDQITGSAAVDALRRLLNEQ
jgi:hypothetical protein